MRKGAGGRARIIWCDWRLWLCEAIKTKKKEEEIAKKCYFHIAKVRRGSKERQTREKKRKGKERVGACLTCANQRPTAQEEGENE